MLMKRVFRGLLNGVLGFQTTFLFGFGVRTWGLWFIGFGVPAVRVGMAAVFQAIECGRFQGRARGCVGGTAVEVVAVCGAAAQDGGGNENQGEGTHGFLLEKDGRCGTNGMAVMFEVV